LPSKITLSFDVETPITLTSLLLAEFGTIFFALCFFGVFMLNEIANNAEFGTIFFALCFFGVFMLNEIANNFSPLRPRVEWLRG
jgi:hypothetical protein